MVVKKSLSCHVGEVNRFYGGWDMQHAVGWQIEEVSSEYKSDLLWIRAVG